MMVLAGDVGGTNAGLAIVELNEGRARIVTGQVSEPRLPGPRADRAPLPRGGRSRRERACLGIACPVVNDDCTAPNLPWTVNAAELAAEIGIPRARIINDFVAVGYGSSC